MSSLMWEFEDDHQMFTEGACHIMAQTLRKLKGWPIYGLETYEESPEGHAFVLLPNGLCLDIDGVSTIDEMCDRWHCDDIRPFDVAFDFVANNWDNWFDPIPCWT